MSKQNLYQNDDSKQAIIVLMVQALINLHQYGEANKIVMDSPNSFVNSISDFLLMIEALTSNDEFIKAREIIAPFQSIQKSYFSKGMEMVRKAEQHFLQFEPLKMKQIAQQYYHLSSHATLYLQKKAFLSGQRLPYEEFIKYSKFILMDPFVHSIIKSELVDTLRKVNFDSSMTIVWLDDSVRTIDFSNIRPLNEMKSYQYSMDRLLHDFADNPEKLSLAMSYFEHQSILMYPFNDDIIRRYDDWYNLTISEYFRDKVYNFPEDKEYLRYIKIIQKQFSSIK